MCQVVHDVAKDTTAKPSQCCIPVVKENQVGNFPEGCSQDNEQCRRHDKAVFVHR